jgi:hypothetical protein
LREKNDMVREVRRDVASSPALTGPRPLGWNVGACGRGTARVVVAD